MPSKAYMYALPYELYEKHGIRRYGFHGTSHSYVAQRAAAILGTSYEALKIITCHLGNGSSIAAVQNGRCVDTSMGMTPLAGAVHGHPLRRHRSGHCHHADGKKRTWTHAPSMT